MAYQTHSLLAPYSLPWPKYEIYRQSSPISIATEADLIRDHIIHQISSGLAGRPEDGARPSFAKSTPKAVGADRNPKRKAGGGSLGPESLRQRSRSRTHHDNVAENAPASASVASSQSRSRVDNVRSSRRKSRVESKISSKIDAN